MRALVPLLLIPLAGCSLAFTQRGPDRVELEREPVCTPAAVAPVIDFTAGAGSLALGGGLLAAGATTADSEFRPRAYGLAGLLIAVAAAQVGSGVYGSRSVSHCRAARDEWAELRQRHSDKMRETPLATVPMRILNGHADTAFRFQVTLPDSDEVFPWSDWTRLRMGKGITIHEAIPGRDGQRVVLHLRAMFMGQVHTFRPIEMKFTGSPLWVLYEWDSATGGFIATARWSDEDGGVETPRGGDVTEI